MEVPVRLSSFRKRWLSSSRCPDTESMKKIIREYDQAILMNGPKGKALTEAVVKLEAESHHMGYYKAFALTALSTGPSDSSNPGAV